MSTVSLMFERKRNVADSAPARLGRETMPLPAGEMAQLVGDGNEARKTFVK
jgi:hypothetical protein